MPWIHFLKKKEVAQKEEKKGHLTSEEDGKPNFKGRMMADPLIIGPVVFLELKVGRSPMVVKEQFPFRPAASSIPEFDSRILDRSRSRASSVLIPRCA
jgi:hypothetical protein